MWSVQHLLTIFGISICNAAERPNIVLMVMDDIGFNDVSWFDHSDVVMPFLDKFVREEALRVDTFYAYPLCSISRTALLTGRYPLRYGLQSSVIENGYPFGLSIFENIITEDLKQSGYKTAMIGKWHLGFHRHDMTPLQRGFDTFHGSLSPMIHFWTYYYQVVEIEEAGESGYEGYDLRIDNKLLGPDDTDSQYLTYWEREQFLNVLDKFIEEDSENEKPWFIYLAFHASHSPHDAPDECLDLYTDSECDDNSWDPQGLCDCDNHKVVQAQTSCADSSIEAVIKGLKELKDGEIWDNTLLIFLSDNGAPPWDGDNSPLRGSKKYIYEGGVRTPSFIAGGYLNDDRKGKVFGDGMVPLHAVDLYPTILTLAKIENEDRLGDTILDGIDQWGSIQFGLIPENAEAQKREFVYNTENDGCDTGSWCGAYRYGPWKLLWTTNSDEDQIYWYDFYATSQRYKDDGTANPDYDDFFGCGIPSDDVQLETTYDENGDAILPCNDKPCLFNLFEDPCEYYDLSDNDEYEDLYQFMYNMMLAWYDNQQLPLAEYYADAIDPRADPVAHDNFWMPWLRDYGGDDTYIDFEDVMKEYAIQNDINDDIAENKYYKIAQTYKIKWEEQIASKEEKKSDVKQGIFYGEIWTAIIAIVTMIGILILSCWLRVCAKEYRKSMVGFNPNMNDEYTPLVKS